MKNNERFYTSKELCEFLNISNSKLARWRSKKSIPFYKFGNDYRYDYKEIKTWLKVNKVA